MCCESSMILVFWNIGIQSPTAAVKHTQWKWVAFWIIFSSMFESKNKFFSWFQMPLSNPPHHRTKLMHYQARNLEAIHSKTKHLPFPSSFWQLRFTLFCRINSLGSSALWYLYCSCLSHFSNVVQSSGNSLITTLQAKQSPLTKAGRIFLD